MKAGKSYGIRNAGYYAMRKLRVEKLFAFWGQDLTTDDTPFECGREFRVKFDVGINNTVKPAHVVNCITGSPFSCPVIENFILTEPLFRGHLSYKATF